MEKRTLPIVTVNNTTHLEDSGAAQKKVQFDGLILQGEKRDSSESIMAKK